MATQTISSPERGQFRLQTARVEKLAARLEEMEDAEARAIALDLVQSVIELHGSALQAMLRSLSATAEGERALAETIENDLVAAMLLLHGLHPDDIETRVNRGIEKVQPYLKSHGGDVELTGVRDGIVRLRLHGNCDSCPSSAITLKTSIEDALFEAAPDIVEIIVEKAPAETHAKPQLVAIG